MKKTILIILLILSSSFGLAVAQSPTPAPPSAAATPASVPAPPAAMKLPPQTQAAFVAGQIIQQVTTILNQVIQVIDNGVPAQPNSPEISAKDLQAALGPNNVMRLRSAVAVLSEAPTLTPTPAAEAAPKK